MKPTVSLKQQLAPIGKIDAPHQRIERDKQRVRRFGIRLRQPVEQRRLAGIGVADKRHRRHIDLVTPLAQLRSAPPHDVDLVLQRFHAHANAPAIRFELGFAGTPRADAAAEPRQRLARSDEARQKVLQLGELDLQLAFSRAGAPREDVQDQLRAIDHLAIEPLVELAQLRRRQLVVEDHQVGVGFGRGLRQHIDLAAAKECRGIGLGPVLQHAQDDARARGVGKTTQLFEGMFRVHSPGTAGDETDECCPFDEHWTPCTH